MSSEEKMQIPETTCDGMIGSVPPEGWEKTDLDPLPDGWAPEYWGPKVEGDGFSVQPVWAPYQGVRFFVDAEDPLDGNQVAWLVDVLQRAALEAGPSLEEIRAELARHGLGRKSMIPDLFEFADEHGLRLSRVAEALEGQQ